ncbi:MAG TPA: hypothetical protein VEL76_28825 [Gemmataceae bacterium]|nr:hypothetical protein [Gemmataceae bacterium]
MLRRTSLLFGILAVVMACWGGYLWLTLPPVRPLFVVLEPDRHLGECPVGQSLLAFRITNQSDQPREIIGLAEG